MNCFFLSNFSLKMCGFSMWDFWWVPRTLVFIEKLGIRKICKYILVEKLWKFSHYNSAMAFNLSLFLISANYKWGIISYHFVKKYYILLNQTTCNVYFYFSQFRVQISISIRLCMILGSVIFTFVLWLDLGLMFKLFVLVCFKFDINVTQKRALVYYEGSKNHQF